MGPNHQNDINKLEMIQHRAARLVLGHPWRKSTRDNISSMLQSLGWPTLATNLQEMCQTDFNVQTST